MTENTNKSQIQKDHKKYLASIRQNLIVLRKVIEGFESEIVDCDLNTLIVINARIKSMLRGGS